jgi:hypothetical protein
MAQFAALLKKAGRDLVDESNWTHLRQEYALMTQSTADATTNNQQTWGAYPLPADWRNMIDQSGWNRTTRLPLGGPLSEQAWQFLNSRLAGVVFTVLFRPMQGLLYLYPAGGLPAGQEIVASYKSSWWVQDVYGAGFTQTAWAPSTPYNLGVIRAWAASGRPYILNFYRCVMPGTTGLIGPDASLGSGPHVPKTSGAIVDGTCVWNYVGASWNLDNTNGNAGEMQFTFGTSNNPTTGASKLMFDEALLVAKLKLLWLKAKGFESDDAEREYRRVLEEIVSNDQAAPKLSLTRSGAVVDRLMGGQNYPITGFGS